MNVTINDINGMSFLSSYLFVLVHCRPTAGYNELEADEAAAIDDLTLAPFEDNHEIWAIPIFNEGGINGDDEEDEEDTNDDESDYESDESGYESDANDFGSHAASFESTDGIGNIIQRLGQLFIENNAEQMIISHVI